MKGYKKTISSCLIAFFCFGKGVGQNLQEAKSLIAQGREGQALDVLAANSDDNNPLYLNLMGEALMRKGRYEEAHEYFDKAAYLLETADIQEPLVLAATYSFTAVLHWTTGNDQLALQYHFKALALREQAGDLPGMAASANDIGLVYSRTRPQEALAYYEQALTRYRKLYGEENDRVVSSYVNMGLAYSNLDFQLEALDNLEKALNLRLQLGGHAAQEAFIHSAIGKVRARLGEEERALLSYQRALDIYRQLYGTRHPEIASTLYLIGSLLHTRGEFKSALDKFQEALIANVADFQDTDIYVHPPLAGYYNADVLLRTLLEKARTLEDLHYNYSLRIKDLSTAYETLALCDSLIDKIRQFRVSEADKVALGSLAYEVYEAAVRLSMDMAGVKWQRQPYLEKAFYYADKSKTAVLLDAIADANAKSYAGIPADLLEQEKIIRAEVAYYQQKLAGKPTAEEEKTYREALFEWTRSYNDFIEGLEQLYPTYFNLKHNARIPAVAEIQARLQPGEALISYFVAETDRVVYAFVLDRQKLRVHQAPLSDDYDRNISAYRNAMYYRAPDTYRAAARALYGQLLFFRLPAGIRQLIIIPSGRMATLPFEALLTREPEEGQAFEELPYLVRDYRLSYQYSAGLFMNPRQEMPAEATASLFAPVHFGRHHLPPLPGTEREVKEISNLFAGGRESVMLYLNEQACLEAIRSPEVTRSKYLHFATHGIVDEKYPERSQICLAAADGRPVSLYSGDIYALDLNADLVVLSACETGLGKISRGEGIIGLTRALIYAGSNNLVVSLWQVSDASTAVLMTNFYRAMLQGNGYAASLADAKLDMINSPGHAAPYYWAPFVLIGR